jgi:hypothetical protein
MKDEVVESLPYCLTSLPNRHIGRPVQKALLLTLRDAVTAQTLAYFIKE